MSVGAALRDLGRFLDECDDGSVSSIGLAECNDSGERGVTAEIEVTVATCPVPDGPVTLSEAGVDSDGTLQLAFESVDPVVPTDYDLEFDVTETTVADDGSITVTLSVSVPTDEPVVAEPTTAPDGAETERDEATGRDRSVPPFRDPDLLAEVYESCDTFAEMTEALGMDVTPETVRRYMVDYDIHQPNSYNTGDAGDEPAAEDGPQVPPVLADGIGLPDDVTAETLIETVKRSNTIYEIKQDIGVEREDALEMLRELNLLDLVVGRLATEAERDISREEIVDRLRAASAAQ